MTTTDRRHDRFAAALLTLLLAPVAGADDFSPAPFGAAYPQLDRWVTGEWWTEPWNKPPAKPGPRKPPQRPPFALDVPRDQVTDWEKGFLTFIRDQVPELRSRIETSKELDGESERQLEAAIAEFKRQRAAKSGGEARSMAAAR